jgi:DNA repair protein RecO (recombination protein O)
VPRPRVYKVQAIVLRQRRLGDADKIVTLYCDYRGKLDAVAKGVRRTRSRLAGHLEPLTLGSYLLAHGRELDIITQAESVALFRALRADLDRLGRGLYCAELVDRLLPERSEGHPVFLLLRDLLQRLDSRPETDLAVRYFETRLLGELGYAPALDACAGCSSALQAEMNVWVPLAGGVFCPRCARREAGPVAPLSVNALKVLRLLQRAPFDEVARLRLPAELAREVEGHLTRHVHLVLEREVRSARFLEALRRVPPAVESVAVPPDV